MKKSELTQLTQIVECLVSREIRKQLPKIIEEVFENKLNKTVVNEQIQPVVQEKTEEDVPEQINTKQSLRELFAGTSVMKQPEARTPRQYAKDPVLNQILNETTPFQRGYNPAVASSVASISSIPSGTHPVLVEGRESTHVPMEVIPQGVSVLDIAKQVPLEKEVKYALTRNYSDMMKLIDQKKGKKV